METTANCPLASALARRLRASRTELTARWLERIGARVALEPHRIFPSEELLDHVPLLIDGIADYIEDPACAVSADPPVVAKAMELGGLRHAQGFDAYEILKEYELLGGILFAFLAREVERIDAECSRAELLVCAHRLFHALSLIEQATTVRFLELTRERLKEREERLRAFNRALTHELKNRIGAAVGAAELLENVADLPAEQQQRMLGIVTRNVRSMKSMLENLVELSRLEANARQSRRVLLPQAVREVVRELRDTARAAGVEVRIGELPQVEISAAAVELALGNLVGNAIKYADAARPDRWVEISAQIVRPAESDVGGELVIRVRDNGIGVPPEKRAQLFQRFFRAHTASEIEGTGLGLNIVRETIGQLGGRVWAEFPAEGAEFSFAIPCRRSEDAATRAVPHDGGTPAARLDRSPRERTNSDEQTVR